MKTTIKIALALLFFFFLLGIKGAKALDEFTKVIKREYAVNPDAQLTVNNRFGKIHCSNWDKPAVAIEVTVRVFARNQEEAEKLFRRINISINATPGSVSAETDLGDMKTNGKSKYSIDYMISMPASLGIDLTNKFGDIFVNEVNGKARISLGYGNLDARRLGNSDNLLDIRFAKARVNWIKGAVLSLKYSEMDLDYAGSLRLDSKFSDLDADKIIALNVVFEGGKLNMEKSSAVESRSRFSDIDIGRIEQSLSLDIQYGSCEVGEMAAEFTSVSIRNKYGDVSVGLSGQARYALDADLKFCDLDFPEERAHLSYRAVTGTSKTYRGTVGGNESPAARVTVNSKFGNVSLQ